MADEKVKEYAPLTLDDVDTLGDHHFSREGEEDFIRVEHTPPVLSAWAQNYLVEELRRCYGDKACAYDTIYGWRRYPLPGEAAVDRITERWLITAIDRSEDPEERARFQAFLDCFKLPNDAGRYGKNKKGTQKEIRELQQIWWNSEE